MKDEDFQLHKIRKKSFQNLFTSNAMSNEYNNLKYKINHKKKLSSNFDILLNKNFNINNTNLPSIKNQLSSRRIIESVPESTKEHVVHFNNSKEHPLSNKMKLMKKMSKMSKISRQSQATFADEDNLFYDNILESFRKENKKHIKNKSTNNNALGNINTNFHLNTNNQTPNNKTSNYNLTINSNNEFAKSNLNYAYPKLKIPSSSLNLNSNYNYMSTTSRNRSLLDKNENVTLNTNTVNKTTIDSVGNNTSVNKKSIQLSNIFNYGKTDSLPKNAQSIIASKTIGGLEPTKEDDQENNADASRKLSATNKKVKKIKACFKNSIVSNPNQIEVSNQIEGDNKDEKQKETFQSPFLPLKVKKVASDLGQKFKTGSITIANAININSDTTNADNYWVKSRRKQTKTDVKRFTTLINPVNLKKVTKFNPTFIDLNSKKNLIEKKAKVSTSNLNNLGALKSGVGVNNLSNPNPNQNKPAQNKTKKKKLKTKQSRNSSSSSSCNSSNDMNDSDKKSQRFETPKNLISFKDVKKRTDSPESLKAKKKKFLGFCCF